MSELDDLEEFDGLLAGAPSKRFSIKFSSHCPARHLLSDDNIIVTRKPNGKVYRRCKACHRQRMREADREKKREAGRKSFAKRRSDPEFAKIHRERAKESARKKREQQRKIDEALK